MEEEELLTQDIVSVTLTEEQEEILWSEHYDKMREQIYGEL
jgi:hypothetical protein